MNSATTPMTSKHTEGITATGAAELVEGVVQSVTLQKLNVGMNQLGDIGVATFAAALTRNSSVMDVGLGLNGMGKVGLAALCKMWPTNATITTLHLNNNQFGPEGMQELCKGLRRATQLQTLHLDCNDLGDKGATQIAEVIPSLARLSTLTLQQNSIGDKGAQMLGMMVATSRLINLDLASNDICELGAIALVRCSFLHHGFCRVSVISPIEPWLVPCLFLHIILHSRSAIGSSYCWLEAIGRVF
jgi:hypothetical protein